MINRDENAYEQFFLPNSLERENAFNVTEAGGGMYIGLKQLKRSRDGSKIEQFVPIDDRYVSAMFERFEDGVLMGRDNMEDCSVNFEDDFAEKVKYTPELNPEDLPKLKCLPAKQTSLFRDAEKGNYSSVNILLSECGSQTTETITIVTDAPTNEAKESLEKEAKFYA